MTFWMLEEKQNGQWNEVFRFKAANIDEALREFVAWTDPWTRDVHRFRPVSVAELTHEEYMRDYRNE